MGRSTHKPVVSPVIKSSLNYGAHTTGVACMLTALSNLGGFPFSGQSRASCTPYVGDHPTSPPTVELSPGGYLPMEKRSRSIQEMTTTQILEQLVKHQPSNSGSIDISDRLIIPDQDIPFASSGFGDVYRGLLRDGRPVAIKCLRPAIKQNDEGRQTLKRAIDEFVAWFQCKHPNVHQLLGITQYRKQLAMVSPWMPHGTLNRFLSSNPHHVHELSNLCCQIAQGVAYLHGMGIVHGDIKAVNVLVSADRTAVLAEFGSSILREHSSYANISTEVTGASFRWMAPELFEGSGTPTTKGDIYSLGMTILEVITGSEPYTGLDTMTALQSILSRKLPIRPERHLPSGDMRADLLWALLQECWAEEPQGRPIADEVTSKLRNLATKPVE